MPYIRQVIRDVIDSVIHEARWWVKNNREVSEAPTVGELNYIVTSLLHAWLGKAPSYADYNAAIGVLECAKLELYRRQVAAYEDRKIAENGDVTP